MVLKMICRTGVEQANKNLLSMLNKREDTELGRVESLRRGMRVDEMG